jgi:hypothetical protein
MALVVKKISPKPKPKTRKPKTRKPTTTRKQWVMPRKFPTLGNAAQYDMGTSSEDEDNEDEADMLDVAKQLIDTTRMTDQTQTVVHGLIAQATDLDYKLRRTIEDNQKFQNYDKFIKFVNDNSVWTIQCIFKFIQQMEYKLYSGDRFPTKYEQKAYEEELIEETRETQLMLRNLLVTQAELNQTNSKYITKTLQEITEDIYKLNDLLMKKGETVEKKQLTRIRKTGVVEGMKYSMKDLLMFLVKGAVTPLYLCSGFFFELTRKNESINVLLFASIFVALMETVIFLTNLLLFLFEMFMLSNAHNTGLPPNPALMQGGMYKSFMKHMKNKKKTRRSKPRNNKTRRNKTRK